MSTKNNLNFQHILIIRAHREMINKLQLLKKQRNEPQTLKQVRGYEH